MDILISANFTCSPIYKFLTEIIKKTNKFQYLGRTIQSSISTVIGE